MIRITLLAENTTVMGMALMGEHGLSFLVETASEKILFDTGQGLVLTSNAKALGKDLEEVDTVVLSHGHYDHTGGLHCLGDNGKKRKLVAHPEAFKPKWAGRQPDQVTGIGCPLTPEALEKKGFEIQRTRDSLALTKGIRTTGEIPMVTPWERVESCFFAGNQIEQDSMPDDMGLILDTDKGTVLLLGCTHRGLINTLTHVASLTGSNHFHAIMGGLHLGEADPDRLNHVSEGLKAFSFDQITVGHCTGIHAYCHLRRIFGEKVRALSVGSNWLFSGVQ